MRRQEKSSRAARRIRDDLAGHWPHTVDQCVDERTRCEVLPRSALGIFRIPFQEALVGIALHVGGHFHPRLIADEVDDELAQLRGILNLVLGLAENEPKHPALLTELLERGAIMLLQLDAFHLWVGKVDPSKAGRD